VRSLVPVDTYLVRSVFSFLPPSTTLRGYQRQSLATTASEIGSVYCSIVSYATSPRAEDPQNVIQNLIAIRLKLKRSIVLRANVIYEVGGDSSTFSLSERLLHSSPCGDDGQRKGTRRSWKFSCTFSNLHLERCFAYTLFQRNRLPSFAPDVGAAASRTGMDPCVLAPYPVFGPRLSGGCPCRHQLSSHQLTCRRTADIRVSV